MLIYKFGGSSLGNAEGISNITDIVKKAPENLVVVISALGKTTNALERVVNLHLAGNLTKARKDLKPLENFILLLLVTFSVQQIMKQERS